jgi:hypothetical protein
VARDARRATVTAASGVLVAGVVRVLVGCGDFGESRPADGDAAAARDSAVDAMFPDGMAVELPPSSTPVAIATGEKPVSRIAVDDTYVFYSEDGPAGSVRRLAKTAGAIPESFALGVSPTALALFGGTLFATSTMNGTVGAFETTSGVVMGSVLVPSPSAIVADKAGIVFLELAGADPGAYALPLTLDAGVVKVTTTGGPAALAINDTHAYVSFGKPGASHFVRHTGRDGAGTIPSSDVGAPITVVALDTTWVYLATGSRVLALPLNFATNAVPSLIHDFGTGAEITSIRTADSYLLVATQGAMGGSIYVLPSAAAAGERMPTLVSRLKDGDCKLPDMAIDTSSIYFLCVSSAGAGSVWRVARPLK